MKYKEYLKTKHWKNFRNKILSERKRCQNCGYKKNLNVHHKNYDNLWNESNEDVIVLCQKCHNRFHKKKKWERKMKNGQELDFTSVSERAKQRDFYNLESDVKRKCRRCGEMHSLFYKEYKNGKRLIMICPNSKPRTEFLPFEEGLDIPVLPRGKI